MPGPGTDLLKMRPPPRVPSPAEVAQSYIMAQERPIVAWLDKHSEWALGLSENAVTAEILRNVPGALDYGVGAVRGVALNWAGRRGRRFPRMSKPPHPADQHPPTESRPLPVVAAVKGAVKTMTDGVDVKIGPVNTNVSISGATAKLALPRGGTAQAKVSPSGDVSGEVGGRSGKLKAGSEGASATVKGGGIKVTTGVTWKGEMRFSTSLNGFNFKGTLSKDRWTATLSFPTAKMPQDVSRLGKVFGEAESAARDIAAATRDLGSIEDVAKMPDALGDQLKDVKKAVAAAARIQASKPRIMFGVQAQGPGPDPSPDASRESRVMALVTVTF